MKLNFTRKTLDALPCPSGRQRAYHHDTGVRGLAVGVSATGRKTFVLYRKIQGRPERVTIGPYPDLSIEQARGLASQMNSSIARGENPSESRRAIRAEMTFEQLFEIYLERYSKIYKRVGAKIWSSTAGTYPAGKRKSSHRFAKPMSAICTRRSAKRMAPMRPTA